MEPGSPELSSDGRAALVGSLRRLAGRRTAQVAAAPLERCDICRIDIPSDHRHLLQLEDRLIVCVCEPCWALRSGDPEYRPTGNRVVWLDDLDFPDELWSAFSIPIGLAFFF